MPIATVALTKSDLSTSGWEDVVNDCGTKACNYYFPRFFERAREARGRDDTRSEAMLVLLGAVSSFSLKLDTKEQPFEPWAVFRNSRGAAVEDLGDEDLVILEEILPEIVDTELRARIADILWIKRRDHRHARSAVESYLEAGERLLSPEEWPLGADRIERALQLAMLLGKQNPQVTEVVAHIRGVLNRFDGVYAKFLPARLIQILLAYGQGNCQELKSIAETEAKRAESEEDWPRVQEYLNIEARCYELCREPESRRVAQIAAAEVYVKEAEAALQREEPSYLAASTFITKAIEALRSVGNVQDRIDELHRVLLEYQSQIEPELTRISAKGDVSTLIEEAIKRVSGKALEESLHSLAAMGSLPSQLDLRAQVEKLASDNIFTSLVSHVTLNGQGRVIGRRSPILAGDTNDTEAAIRAEMFRAALRSHSIHIIGVVEPAREQINLEHNVRPHDFLSIVSDNPFVPPGREWIFARGLYYGLIGDFVLSTSLLVPQVEHSLRYLLAQAGAVTSTLTSDSVQEEYDLNRILFMPELRAIFDEDLIFNLRALLIERFGSNLRNRVAHGLIDSDGFLNVASIYLWWLILRLCCWPVLMEMDRQVVEDGAKEGEADSAEDRAGQETDKPSQ